MNGSPTPLMINNALQMNDASNAKSPASPTIPQHLIMESRNTSGIVDTLCLLCLASSNASSIGSPRRTWLDRVVDSIIGDVGGPQTKYALVCEQCFTHNGLIPPELYSTARKHLEAKILNLATRIPMFAMSSSQSTKVDHLPNEFIGAGWFGTL